MRFYTFALYFIALLDSVQGACTFTGASVVFPSLPKWCDYWPPEIDKRPPNRNTLHLHQYPHWRQWMCYRSFDPYCLLYCIRQWTNIYRHPGFCDYQCRWSVRLWVFHFSGSDCHSPKAGSDFFCGILIHLPKLRIRAIPRPSWPIQVL